MIKLAHNIKQRRNEYLNSIIPDKSEKKVAVGVKENKYKYSLKKLELTIVTAKSSIHLLQNHNHTSKLIL